jgi:ADP-ribose pyrophosphatase YjhB (NUDIX family)
MINFDDGLRAQLAANLAAHPTRTIPLDGRKHAAVAIVVIDSDQHSDLEDDMKPASWVMRDVPGDVDDLDGRMIGVSGGASFVLCRRTSKLSNHAGQWALPGGRVDAGETAAEAALREVDEEVGLRLEHDAIVGWLDDYPTRSGYVISPAVVWGGANADLVLSPDEVFSAYRIGLHALRDGEPRFVTIPESDRPVVQIPLGNDLVHAPTGAVLYQFRQVAMAGRAGERVDHLEQPVFAWT